MDSQDTIKEELKELTIGVIDSTIQLVSGNPIFSLLPILGTADKLSKIAYTIKKKADALYERFLLRIEKFDDIDKPVIYAKIFACHLKGKITEDDREQLGYALSVSSIQNLCKFSRSFLSQQYGGTYNEQADMESLAFCGLTSLGLVETAKSLGFGLSGPITSGIAGFTGVNRLPYGVNFSVTELGKLYAFIAEDLEDFFSLQIDSRTGQKSYQFITELNQVQLRDVVQERLSI